MDRNGIYGAVNQQIFDKGLDHLSEEIVELNFFQMSIYVATAFEVYVGAMSLRVPGESAGRPIFGLSSELFEIRKRTPCFKISV